MYYERWFYIYIPTNRSRTLCTDVTGGLKTGKYVNNAIAREKQIKRWSKIKKVRLIVDMNPT